MNKGFADLFLKPLNPYVKHFGLIEFKFFRKKDKKDITKLINQAKTQLNQYEQDEIVQNYIKDGKILQKVVLVFRDFELVEAVRL